MGSADRLPQTLVEAIRYFTDRDVCNDFVAALRWPDGPVCPSCQGTEHSYLTTRRLWKCKACKRQFSVKVGTIFEDSALGLDKWLAAIWLIANSKNGISSHELARSIGVTQKSAWFLLHRIRLAMQTGSFEKFNGVTEADETYVGGLARNMHAKKRREKLTGTGGIDKAIVFGVIERGGPVRASIVGSVSKYNLQRAIRETVETGSVIYTDRHQAYAGLSQDYAHETVDHAVEYVSGQIHTNSMEAFWSLLKRGLKGTYISVEPFHLFRYLDERVYAFNNRESSDFARFAGVLSAASGRRLTWLEVTGHAPVAH
jgi:transposase-like protein